MVLLSVFECEYISREARGMKAHGQLKRSSMRRAKRVRFREEVEVWEYEEDEEEDDEVDDGVEW